MRRAAAGAVVVLIATTAATAGAQRPHRAALTPSNVEDIARLELLEDRRQFDSTTLGRLLDDPHPELRRRATLAVARIVDKRGVALLRSRPLDRDTALAATTVFAVGQLRDTATIAFFDSLLTARDVAPTVATEAAVALGKIKTTAARAVLARYLTTTVAAPRTTPVIAEALLSIGRSPVRGALAPITRWTTSANEELRWRATWALFRPRDPQSVRTLLALSADRSPLVRSWAVRGLTRAQADTATVGAQAEQRLLLATRDADRRVRTEALRAIATYGDSTAAAALVAALASTDSWISVSAAEGLARIRMPQVVPALVDAAAARRGCALRITAMQSLQIASPRDALAVAHEIARDTVPYCRTTALQLIARDTSRSPGDRRADLASTDSDVRLVTLRAMSTWADSTDLAMLLDLYDREQHAPSTAIASAAAAAIGGVQRRHGTGAAQFFARFSPPANASLRRDVDRALGAAARAAWPAAAVAVRDADEYLRIVKQWVVPDYEGKARPTARWETPRGPIDLELYPGDAPLAVDDFVRTMESGAIAGTDFTRVVPDFVDQQRTIRDGNTLRDEVNRHRLARGNLAWATAGLDTGSPGYTLNHTPQPHNEGDFTSLGRVIRGMDAVDHIELGDRVTAGRMLTGKP